MSGKLQGMIEFEPKEKTPTAERGEQGGNHATTLGGGESEKFILTAEL